MDICSLKIILQFNLRYNKLHCTYDLGSQLEANSLTCHCTLQIDPHPKFVCSHKKT